MIPLSPTPISTKLSAPIFGIIVPLLFVPMAVLYSLLQNAVRERSGRLALGVFTGQLVISLTVVLVINIFVTAIGQGGAPLIVGR